MNLTQSAFLRDATSMLLRRQFLLALTAAIAAVGSDRGGASAEESSSSADPFTPSDEFQELLTKLARDQLPEKYEKSKNWGKTTRVFAGWKIEPEGLKLETRRRYTEVNDGAWQKYSIQLLNPDKRFEVRVANLRQQENQPICDVTVIASVKVTGRHAQWENGVQLVSIGAEADARLRLRAELAVGMKLDPTKFPPDVFFEPRVTKADIDILEFKLRKISHFGGPVVKSLSSSVREVLEDKIAESRPKLVQKLNKSLAKQDAKLRFSAADWLAKLGGHSK